MSRIVFIEPHMAIEHGHLGLTEHGLIMEIDIFCLDMVAGVERWSADVKDNTEIRERRLEMVDILWDDDYPDARVYYDCPSVSQLHGERTIVSQKVFKH